MIDDHCHPFATEGGALDLSSVNLDTSAGPLAVQRRQASAPWRASQELMTRRIAARLGCPPGELAAARAEASKDWPSYAAGLFRDAGLDQLVMDADYPPGSERQLGTYASLARCPVHRIARVEPAIDAVIDRGGTAREVLEAAQSAMTAAADAGAVGFKSILAYRTGLDVQADVTERDADESVRERLPLPRRGKACRDWVLRRLLGTAADLGLPFQIHTGFGDPDLRLRECNPLLLEDLLRSAEGSVATVLLMVAYPWHEELAYLTATKPNVHADLSMFTLYTPLTLADRLLRVIDLAPASKLLLGTDGYAEPEVYWFGATMLAEAWVKVAAALTGIGCDPGWVSTVKTMLFESNARHFYRLPG
jgi:predicted TIM-barrel fold metal-dependent hydrolase